MDRAWWSTEITIERGKEFPSHDGRPCVSRRLLYAPNSLRIACDSRERREPALPRAMVKKFSVPWPPQRLRGAWLPAAMRRLSIRLSVSRPVALVAPPPTLSHDSRTSSAEVFCFAKCPVKRARRDGGKTARRRVGIPLRFRRKRTGKKRPADENAGRRDEASRA